MCHVNSLDPLEHFLFGKETSWLKPRDGVKVVAGAHQEKRSAMAVGERTRTSVMKCYFSAIPQ